MWLVIELDLDVMVINILTQFGNDWLMSVQVRERKPFQKNYVPRIRIGTTIGVTISHFQGP